MKKGDIIQYKPNVFSGQSGINAWARRACEKGTLFLVKKVEGSFLKAEILDDPEIFELLITKHSEGHVITMRTKNLQKVQDRQQLRKMLRDGKISAESYLASSEAVAD